MGLDIGIAKGFDWALAPTRALGERLTHIAFDEFGNASLSLLEVRRACEEHISETDDTDEKQNAQAFLGWWTDYWQQRGLDECESLTIKFDA